MNYKQEYIKLFFVFILVILFSSGCHHPEQLEPEPEPGQISDLQGKESSLESLKILRGYADDVWPFKANGKCVASFYVEGKNKPKRENFAVKLWFEPPSNIRLNGDVAFNPRGIDLGANKQEFWLSMKPKEIGNSYFWGLWSDGLSFGNLKISPKVLLEAFGNIEINEDEPWSLLTRDRYDILSKRNEQGKLAKRVHIYHWDYRVRKIEYFNDNGVPIVVLELDAYRDIYDGFLVPTVVKLISYNADGTEDSFRIKLDSIKRLESFRKKTSDKLFTRPRTRGFKNIYQLAEGRIIEQSK